jgi:GTP pyrophosphokinase
LVEEERDGIADWFAGAWKRLPEDVLSTIAAWQIRQIVDRRLVEGDGYDLSPAPLPPGLRTSHAVPIAKALRSVRLGVRRVDMMLTLGEVSGTGLTAIEVPQTTPLLVDVCWRRGDMSHIEPVAITEGQVVRTRVGLGPVQLRTASGAEYELSPVAVSAALRLRARLASFGTAGAATSDIAEDPQALEPLFEAHRVNYPKADLRVLQRAFETAVSIHSGQTRGPGAPYITHPLAVATILASLGMDTSSLVAAILHKTVTSSDYTLDQMSDDFGADVAVMVAGLMDLKRVWTVTSSRSKARSDSIRGVLAAVAKDPRIAVLKLADQLHNMRTVASIDRIRQEREATETLELASPMAYRLGINVIRRELEDLAFEALHPKRHNEIRRLSSEHASRRNALLGQVVQKVGFDLKTARITAEVFGQTRNAYSTYQRMINWGRDFHDVDTMINVHVLVETVRECYAAIGIIHANWHPIPDRLNDYIAAPRLNLYQALQTAVLGPSGKPIEIQVKTRAMHRAAEYGIVTRWRQDGARDASVGGALGNLSEMTWLANLMDWWREMGDPVMFLDSVRFEQFAQAVYVFTPDGDVYALPRGSTPLDLAYAIRTEVGHNCTGAVLNGRSVPLSTILSNRDVVEILTSTSTDGSPSRDLLDFARSPRARSRILDAIDGDTSESVVERGRDEIAEAIRGRRLRLQGLMSSHPLRVLLDELRLTDVTALFLAVGMGHVSAKTVVASLAASQSGELDSFDNMNDLLPGDYRGLSRDSGYTTGVELLGIDDTPVKLARCCTPLLGDPIFGILTTAGVASVHHEQCHNASELRADIDRVLRAAWLPNMSSVFLVTVRVEALDRQDLLADVTEVLAEERVHVASAAVSTSGSRITIAQFSIELADPTHLSHLMSSVRRVNGVFDVQRHGLGASS